MQRNEKSNKANTAKTETKINKVSMRTQCIASIFAYCGVISFCYAAVGLISGEDITKNLSEWSTPFKIALAGFTIWFWNEQAVIFQKIQNRNFK